MEAKRLDGQVTFRISRAMLKRLKAVAAAEKRKVADMTRILFVRGFSSYIAAANGDVKAKR